MVPRRQGNVGQNGRWLTDRKLRTSRRNNPVEKLTPWNNGALGACAAAPCNPSHGERNETLLDGGGGIPDTWARPRELQPDYAR